MNAITLDQFKKSYCNGYETNANRNFGVEDVVEMGLEMIVIDEEEAEGIEPEKIYVADVTDGAKTIRIGYYANNAWTAIDELESADTLKDFCDGWYSNDGDETPEIMKEYLAIA